MAPAAVVWRAWWHRGQTSDCRPGLALGLDLHAGSGYTCVQTKDNANIDPGDSANCPGVVARKGERLPMRDKPTSCTPTGGQPLKDKAREQDVIDALLGDERSRPRLDQPAVEAAIMGLLLSDEHHGPWTRPEVEREMGGSVITAIDSLAALCGSGLIHLQGELVIASRAARRMDELEM
jgi:hypothetical protein